MKIKLLSFSSLKKVDLLAIVFSCFFSFINIYLFFDYSPSFKTRNALTVAQVKHRKNDVKRKLSGSLAWTQPKLEESLFRGDEIFTGEESQATIFLIKEKIRITLSSNTLIQIEYKEQKPLIEIKKGEAEIQTTDDSELDFKTEATTFAIQSKRESKFKITSAGSRVGVKSINGDISIDKEKISKNSTSALDLKSGTFLESKLPEILVPSNDQIILQEKAELYPSLTNYQNIKKESLEFEISKDQRFEKILVSQSGSSLRPLNNLDIGNYYLRIKYKGVSGLPVNFYVKTNIQFNKMNPINGEKIALERGDQIRLGWEFIPGLKAKVYLKDLLNNSIQIFDVSKSDFAFIPKRDGPYTWKLEGVYNARAIQPSQEHKLGLEFNPFKKLLSPLVDKIPYPLQKQILFQWSNDTHDKFNYKIIDRKTNKEVINGVNTNSSYSWKISEPGEFLFILSSTTYQSLKENDLKFPFIVQSPILKWDPIKDIVSIEKKSEIRLPVKQILTADQIFYDLKVGTKAISSHQVLNLGDKIVLEDDGKYCLKIYPLISNETFYSPDDLCFNYKYKDPFLEIFKADNQILKINKINGSTFYNFKCPTIKRATLYEVLVSKDPEGKNIVFTKKNSNPEFEWRSNRSGIYYFQYRVYDRAGKMSSLSPISKLIFPISPLEDWQ